MSWVLNRLLKTTERTYLPGSPAIPGTAGTAGSPGYTYIAATQVGGDTYDSTLPPSGWDNETTISLPGGGTQVLRSGGYRYFDGVKAYLTVVVGIVYYYEAPIQTVYTPVYVPPVAPVPATPGIPATASETIENYNLGWNSGALGPAILAVNTVLTFRMSGGNIGSVVGLSYATAPQDYGYTGMPLLIMAQSGRYQLFSNGTPITVSKPFVNGDRFSLYRTNAGTVEVYVSGGLIHTEALPEDVVADASLYSGGDVIWDAVEQPIEAAPLLADISAPTTSSAMAVAGAVAVTQTFGPGTARGVAGATTASRAVAGAVTVNGAVNVSIGETSAEGGTGGGMTRTAAVGVAESIGAIKTFGTGTALGAFGSTTASDGVATGDATTGVGISTNVSVSGDMGMLPLTAAGSAPNVFTAWTGNYQGDALTMLPMTSEATGGLVEPIIAIGECIMVPMSNSATGLTGSVSITPGTGGITDPDGDDSGTNPAVIELTGTFEEGTVIYIEYETDSGGTSTIIYTVPADADAATVLADLEAVIEAQPDLVSEVVGSTIEIEPQAPATTVTLLGFQIYPINASFLPMAMFASSEATYSQAYASLYPLTAYATDGVYDPSDFFTVEITEEFFASTPMLMVSYVSLFLDKVGTAGTSQTFINYATQIADDIAVLSTQRTAFVLEVADQYSITDSLTFTQAVQLADAMVAAGTVQTVYQGVVTIISAMVASDATIPAYAKVVTDTAQANDVITDLFQMLVMLTDGVNVADTLQNVLTITVLETAEVDVDDTVELTAQYFNSLLDTVEVVAFIKTPAELAHGWVMNTEGAMPLSEYDNYTFNSLAYSPDEMLGCTDQGLYLLDGDTDDGADISAAITSLMLDFDTSKLKRMSTAYIGYTSTGTLLLRIRSVDQGEYIEDWYEGRNVLDQTPPGENRMKIGKGLRSRYWTFELTNIDGADFEVDKLELYPIVLQRRV